MHSLEVLEFNLIRSKLSDHCESELGKTRAHQLMPDWNAELVWKNQDLSREADRVSQHGIPSLKGLRNLSEDVKMASRGRQLDGVTLWRTGQSLLVLSRLQDSLLNLIEDDSALFGLFSQIPDLADLGFRLDSSLDGDGSVLDGASIELSRLRTSATQFAKNSVDLIQKYVSGRQRDLLSDPLFTQRNGRYVLPLKAEHRGKIRGIVHDSSASGQTIYVEPDDVVSITNRHREALAMAKAEEERILAELSGLVGLNATEIVLGLDAGGAFDELFARVRLKIEWSGCWAEPSSTPAFLNLQNARHPGLEYSIAVPLSIQLGGELRGVLITGPNTGGKTVAIKTVGLAVALVQSGLPVPAVHCDFGVFSQIWADIGDEQSLQQSLSTFSGHIKNIAAALKSMKKDCLVLMDEVGAGTDPAEGAALAQALLVAFRDGGAIILASTHYGELKLFASSEDGFVNASMEFDLKSLGPTYRFLMGTPGSSHAFRIAARYGIPDNVIEKAEAGFSQQEKDISRMIEELESAQKRARQAQSEADRLAARLRKLEAETDEKLAAAEDARTKVRRRMSEELDELLRQMRIEAVELFDAVKKNPTQKSIDHARAKLADLQDVGKSFSRDLRPAEKIVKAASIGEIQKGMQVKVLGLNVTGVVLEPPKGKKVSVQAGALRMDVEINKLIPIGMIQPTAVKSKRRSSKLVVEKAISAQKEIHLRHYRAEDAKEELEKFVDDCLLAGLQRVRIVHGKGEGVLRKVTREYLRSHSGVAKFYDGDAEEGGQGVTIVEFS